MIYFDNKKVLVHKNIFGFSLIYDKMLTKHESIEMFFFSVKFKKEIKYLKISYYYMLHLFDRSKLHF